MRGHDRPEIPTCRTRPCTGEAVTWRVAPTESQTADDSDGGTKLPALLIGVGAVVRQAGLDGRLTDSANPRPMRTANW